MLGVGGKLEILMIGGGRYEVIIWLGICWAYGVLVGETPLGGGRIVGAWTVMITSMILDLQVEKVQRSDFYAAGSVAVYLPMWFHSTISFISSPSVLKSPHGII